MRGDRPDVQMSALTTSTQCLVLTGGIDPIEYVLYEAELEEVPIAVVPSETLDAMAALDDLFRPRTVRPPGEARTPHRAGARAEVDVDALYGQLGVAA